MTNKEAIDRLISLRTSYKIRIEEEDLEALDKGIEALENQKTGHWTRVMDKTGHLVWECNKCKWQQRFNTNYCPNCSAKMGSKKNE